MQKKRNGSIQLPLAHTSPGQQSSFLEQLSNSSLQLLVARINASLKEWQLLSIFNQIPIPSGYSKSSNIPKSSHLSLQNFLYSLEEMLYKYQQLSEALK
jgi:hypothetical protein